MKITDKKMIKRAKIAFRCLPFNSKFYETIQKTGLQAESVVKQKKEFLKNELYEYKNADYIESLFRWLIIVGILRREVDGQGLTSKVRLTPLGRQLLGSNPLLPEEKENYINKLINWTRRKSLMS